MGGLDGRDEALLAAWRRALGHGEPAADRAGRGLLARYDEPTRGYHDRRHLAEVLAALDVLGAGPDGAAVLAAWYHDAVYDPRRPDNEARSAALAAAELPDLGVPAPLVAEVARLVRLTATHDPAAGDAVGAVLCDADLAILGAAPARYAEYVAGVRTEYAALPAAVFTAGRAAVVRDLLGRDPLYRTAAGRRRWAEPARANLAAELRALTVP